MDNLSKRVGRLERENRLLKQIGTFVLVGIAALMLMAQAKPIKVVKVIEAERFVVKDEDGKVRVILGLDRESIWPDRKSKYGLAIYGEGGTKRVSLSHHKIGISSLDLLANNEHHGEIIARLSATDQIGANLDLELPGLISPPITPGVSLYAAVNRLTNFVNGISIYTGNNNYVKAIVMPTSAELSVGAANPEEVKQEQERRATERGRKLEKGFLAAEEYKIAKDLASAIRLVANSKDQTVVALKEKGSIRAVLGHVTMTHPQTEVKEQRPLSSLVLLDKDGKVIWKAP